MPWHIMIIELFHLNKGAVSGADGGDGGGSVQISKWMNDDSDVSDGIIIIIIVIIIIGLYI